MTTCEHPMTNVEPLDLDQPLRRLLGDVELARAAELAAEAVHTLQSEGHDAAAPFVRMTLAGALADEQADRAGALDHLREHFAEVGGGVLGDP